MSFDESQIKRGGDGKFAEKERPHSEAELPAQGYAASVDESYTEDLASHLEHDLAASGLDAPVEVIDDDTIAIGEERDDGLAPMAATRTEDDHWEFTSPDPDGPQRNTTDSTGEATGSSQDVAAVAADFYRDNVTKQTTATTAQAEHQSQVDRLKDAENPVSGSRHWHSTNGTPAIRADQTMGEGTENRENLEKLFDRIDMTFEREDQADVRNYLHHQAVTHADLAVNVRGEGFDHQDLGDYLTARGAQIQHGEAPDEIAAEADAVRRGDL